MRKFHSEDPILGVMKASRFAYASLNRQAILIMSGLGVPDSTFMNKFCHQVAEARAITTDASARLNSSTIVAKKVYKITQVRDSLP
jgi:RNA dependent RNA polymerase